MPRSDRPKRRAIPYRIKQGVVARQRFLCACGCGAAIKAEPWCDTQFDHVPALALRDILPDGSDYIPPQLDPAYIFGKRTVCHRAKTSHPRGPHTSIDSDQHAIAKVRRLRGETCTGPTKAIPSRSFPKGQRKIAARQFEKRKKR